MLKRKLKKKKIESSTDDNSSEKSEKYKKVVNKVVNKVKEDPNLKEDEIDIDNKKKALFKLLIDAKKNTDINIDQTELTDESYNIEKEDTDTMNLIINNKNNNLIIDNKEDILLKKNQINDIIDHKRLKKPLKNLKIISSEITDNECYNDYMITLDNPIKIKDLNINDIKIPKRETENITSENNKLTIEIEEEIKTFELENNYYNRDELLEFLNEGFKINNMEINISINEDEKFVFKSNNDNKFKILNDDNSILSYLGFNKNTYINKKIYTAENSLNIGDNIFYLVIENISDDPLFRIDMDNNKIDKIFELTIDQEIDHLIIKFYKTKNSIIKNDRKYSFFFNEDHQINFEFI